MAAKNPYVGLHPDLFARQPHLPSASLRVPEKGRQVAEAERAAAWKRGETPVFVELESLTSDQIRELPRSAFSNEEWLKVDEDDREYIEDNDTESEHRVNALAAPFIQAYTWESQNDNRDSFDHVEHGLEQYLSENASKMYEEMSTDKFHKLVEYGAARGVPEDDVINAINEILVDTNNYEFTVESHGGGVYAEEIHGDIYVESDQWHHELEACTPDEVERAIDRVRKATDGVVDLDIKDLAKRSYSTDFETGNFAIADVKWGHIEDLARDAIDDIEVPDDRDMPGALPPEGRVAYRWSDGFYVLDLLPSELPAEGKTMGMCVGREDMGYGQAVRDGEAKILSLRRPSGKPLFTIEAAMRSTTWAMEQVSQEPHEPGIASIDQIKGKANRKPGFDLGKDTDIYTETVGPKGRRQVAISALKRDEVERVIEYVMSIGIAPLDVEDLQPALFAINDLRNAKDPWAVKLASKVPGFAKVEEETKATDEPPAENPACDHGECSGFCVPYRQRVRNPPMQGQRYEGGPGLYRFGWEYAMTDDQVRTAIKSRTVDDLLVAVDALQEGKIGEGLTLLGLSDMDRSYRLERTPHADWQRGYRDGVLDMVERQAGLRENPHRDRTMGGFGRFMQKFGVPLNSPAAEHGSAVAKGQLNNLLRGLAPVRQPPGSEQKPAWSASAIDTLRVAGDAVDEGDRDTALGLIRQISGEFDGLRPSDGWTVNSWLVRDAIHINKPTLWPETAPLEGKAFEDYLISYWMEVLMTINEDEPWREWFGGLPQENPPMQGEVTVPHELLFLTVTDRRGDQWDLRLTGVRAEWFGSAKEPSYWVEWVGVPHGTPWTRSAHDEAVARHRTIGLRLPPLHAGPTQRGDSDLGHAFWFTGRSDGRGDRNVELPFAAGSEAATDIIAQSMVVVDAFLAEVRENPGLTAKGDRMYKHIKQAYSGDPRAKEIAARTVYARSRDVPGLRNPKMTRDEAIELFMSLLLDPDPSSMETAQDLALENNLSLADLGEIAADRARRSGTVRSVIPPNGLFLLAAPPNPLLYSGWELSEALQRSWGSQQPVGTHYTYLLRYAWHGSHGAYPKQGYAGKGAFRTKLEARRAAAADAWAVAKLIRQLPTTTSPGEVYEEINSVVRGETRDTSPPELYEHKSTRKAKRPTYVEAQDAAIDAMRRVGWTPSGMLKVRHVTSPSNRIRLWFRPQSVYVSQPSGMGTHTLKDAHSLSVSLPDLRDLSGPQFVDEIRSRFPYEFPRG